jgi:hypothetical protein
VEGVETSFYVAAVVGEDAVVPEVYAESVIVIGVASEDADTGAKYSHSVAPLEAMVFLAVPSPLMALPLMALLEPSIFTS